MANNQHGPRRSETVEQHEYERLIHEAQLEHPAGHSVPSADAQAPANDRENRDSGTKHDFLHRLKDQIKSSFPEAIQDMKLLGGMAALEARVKKEITDQTIFPEIEKVADVRRGLELCAEEHAFLQKRTPRTHHAFARYMGLDPGDVHPEDVPVVAFGGSGGGFRAMLGCLGYCDEMKRSGLWDCLSYVAGVSGSCWSLAAYYTLGRASMADVIDHCKRRFSPHHPLSGEAIRTVLSVPGGARTTLGPLVQKSRSGLDTVAMDLYSVFTTGWIFLQEDPASQPGGFATKEVAGLQRSWYRWSSGRHYVDDGAEPLPILTAIRHERPWKDWVDDEHPFREPDHAQGDHRHAENAWFQWFEMTPYEVGCDEIEAWVPTWAFGRPFRGGRSTMQLPEQSLALLLGLCTSAPAGPLTSYLATISRNLPPGFLGDSVHSLARSITRLWGKQGTEEFQNHHPLHACNEHNFMYRCSQPRDGESRPRGLEDSPRIHLIDSGMDNNCPTYVLLHPERRVDVILSMDASSDVQKDTFPDRVNQIGGRRGLSFTRRRGADPSVERADRPDGRYAQIYDGAPCARPATVVDSYGRTVPNPPAPVVGEEHEVTMVYLPLLPNERAAPGFDPSTAKFSGSYNLVWTPEQVEMLVGVCRANFEDGQAGIRDALRGAWARKKAARESRERMEAGAGR